MQAEVDLSIIILNYKMDGLVKNCLKSIFEHTYHASIEVIVVDNNSGDGCEEIVREQFPRVQFIQSGANFGHAAGNNIGIRSSKGRHVMLVNPDVVFLDNIFDNVVKMMDQKQNVGMATVQLNNPDGTVQTGAWRFHRLLTPLYQRSRILKSFSPVRESIREFVMRDWDRSTSREVDWVQGSCLIARRKTIDKIGLLDENLFLYFTDVDWCRRCWENGWKVYYYADVKAIHYFHRESARSLGLKSLTNRVTRTHIKDWLRYLRKYGMSPGPKSS